MGQPVTGGARGRGKAVQQRSNIGSRMNREVHVRFWERAEVQFLSATRHFRQINPLPTLSACPLRSDRVRTFAPRGAAQQKSVFFDHLVSCHKQRLWNAEMSADFSLPPVGPSDPDGWGGRCKAVPAPKPEGAFIHQGLAEVRA